MDGYVHVYTGDGKGKTTAAFGLALRAAGAGLKVFIAQFVKSEEYGEIAALKRFSDLITCRPVRRRMLALQRSRHRGPALRAKGPGGGPEHRRRRPLRHGHPRRGQHCPALRPGAG